MRRKHYALTKNSYFTLHKRDLSNYLDLLPFQTSYVRTLPMTPFNIKVFQL